MTHQGEALYPSSDKLIDKGHGTMMDGKSPDMARVPSGMRLAASERVQTLPLIQA